MPCADGFDCTGRPNTKKRIYAAFIFGGRHSKQSLDKKRADSPLVSTVLNVNLQTIDVLLSAKYVKWDCFMPFTAFHFKNFKD